MANTERTWTNTTSRHFIKRAAARAIAAPARSILLSAPRSSTTPLAARQSVLSAFKRYNSSIPSSTEPIATDAAEQSSVSSAVAAAEAESSTSAPSSGFSASSGFGMDSTDGTRPNSRPPMDLQPSSSVYIGNLLFEATPQDLEREFGVFGEIVSSKVAQDARGLSKGFGYIEFKDIESARNAIEQRNQTIFEGRRLVVNYMAKSSRSTASKPKNPPSKTLFIGNLAFEMTDADLNRLFRDIANVIDVRVAIDRRTGQPRGFAHADFTDVESAVKAAEVLEGKEVYERALRVDYSLGGSSRGAGQGGRDGGRGRGDRAPREREERGASF
ncbi:hypothetical protein VE03_04843 [Pseudogymnoascus sp. 23342-1-I1]|nr:hypothetical protein VE03_04843 [Pseudogymnoascus sp. 23342-1-I1]